MTKLQAAIGLLVVSLVTFVSCESPMDSVQEVSQQDVVSKETIPQEEHKDLHLCVVSVNGSEMRTINIVFNNRLDLASAEDISNYIVRNNKVSEVEVISAKLLEDEKSVQLFLGEGMYNDFTVDDIKIKGVKNYDRTMTMTTVTKEVTISDDSVPTVVSVEALGTRAIRVNLSEAVQGLSINSFRVDGKTLSTAYGLDTSSSFSNMTFEYPDGGDHTKALIVFADHSFPVGAHKLTVGTNSVTDYNVTTDGTANANVMQSAEYVFSVPLDVYWPTLSGVEVLTQTRVRYTFSEFVLNPLPSQFYWSKENNVINGVFADSVIRISDKVFEVRWASKIDNGPIYFYTGNPVYNGICDGSGLSLTPLPSKRILSVSIDTLDAQEE